VLVLLAPFPSLHAQQNTLKISSQPVNAQVYLDDEPKGTTSPEEGRLVLKDLPADSYKLRIALPGYKDWIQTVFLTEGSTIYIDARLTVAGPAPLTSQDVADLLKGGVSPKRAADLVTQHGVDFALTEPIEKDIRAAGGDDALLLAITKAKFEPAPSPPPALPPAITLLEPKGTEAGKPIEASGPALRVHGTAYHASGIASVSVNGQASLLKVSASGEVEFEAPNLSLDPGSSALVLIATAADRSQVRLELPFKVGGSPGGTKVNPKDGLTYVWIPPGRFMMGCSPGDSECDSNERPAHTVTISKGFWMGQTEVTQGAYQRVMGKNPSGFHGDRLPVEQVTWDDANAYCTAVGMRLPTEAEWEYAARAGSTASRYADLDAIAWYKANSGGQTHEVGQKVPNAWKLYDMLGNVWEWVADWFDGSYYGQSPSQDPRGPSSGRVRALRGGSWSHLAEYTRASDRIRCRRYRCRIHDAGFLGFRCVGE
jgi:formylglycine-generating enzyme required for sulfatase activity